MDKLNFLSFEANEEDGGDPMQKTMLGTNHEATNMRDRIVFSTCLKGEKKLYRIRILLALLSVVFLVAGVVLTVGVAASSGEEVGAFFCAVDFYAWASFIIYLILTLIAVKRFTDFESKQDPSVLQVEIYQSRNNFYAQDLSKIERASVIFFSISFVLQTVATGNAISLFVRSEQLEEFEFSFYVNLIFMGLILVNFFFCRQLLTIWHFLISFLLGIFFIGGSGLCANVMDTEVYPDIAWTNATNIDFPDTVYQSLAGVGCFLVAYLVGYVLVMIRDKIYYTFY